jgi:hypothetical protein
MVMIPGPKAASKSKLRRRNLLIEWIVLLIQYTRADPWFRKTPEQDEIASDHIFPANHRPRPDRNDPTRAKKLWIGIRGAP